MINDKGIESPNRIRIPLDSINCDQVICPLGPTSTPNLRPSARDAIFAALGNPFGCLDPLVPVIEVNSPYRQCQEGMQNRSIFLCHITLVRCVY